jgi:hypothetical protein
VLHARLANQKPAMCGAIPQLRVSSANQKLAMRGSSARRGAPSSEQPETRPRKELESESRPRNCDSQLAWLVCRPACKSTKTPSAITPNGLGIAPYNRLASMRTAGTLPMVIPVFISGMATLNKLLPFFLALCTRVESVAFEERTSSILSITESIASATL